MHYADEPWRGYSQVTMNSLKSLKGLNQASAGSRYSEIDLNGREGHGSGLRFSLNSLTSSSLKLSLKSLWSTNLKSLSLSNLCSNSLWSNSSLVGLNVLEKGLYL